MLLRGYRERKVGHYTFFLKSSHGCTLLDHGTLLIPAITATPPVRSARLLIVAVAICVVVSPSVLLVPTSVILGITIIVPVFVRTRRVLALGALRVLASAVPAEDQTSCGTQAGKDDIANNGPCASAEKCVPCLGFFLVWFAVLVAPVALPIAIV